MGGVHASFSHPSIHCLWDCAKHQLFHVPSGRRSAKIRFGWGTPWRDDDFRAAKGMPVHDTRDHTCLSGRSHRRRVAKQQQQKQQQQDDRCLQDGMDVCILRRQPQSRIGRSMDIREGIAPDAMTIVPAQGVWVLEISQDTRAIVFFRRRCRVHRRFTLCRRHRSARSARS